MLITKKSVLASLKEHFLRLGKLLSGAVKEIGLFLVAIYKLAGAVHLGGACRFEPSCSNYAEKCLEEHHPGRALFLICRRLLKCRPFGPFGFDPVPERAETS